MATSNSTTSSRTGRSPFRETHGDSPNRHATTAGGGSNKTTPSWFVASDSEQEHFHRPSHKNEEYQQYQQLQRQRQRQQQ